MILKKQEKDNLIKAMYNSSNIIASIYDKEASDLTLIFNKGTQYKYAKVSNTDYTRFELAESQGKVFNSHIKSHSFEKLGDINPDTIINEVKNLKAAEDKVRLDAKQLNIVKEMKALILVDDVVGGPNFTETQLERLQLVIAEYITEAVK